MIIGCSRNRLMKPAISNSSLIYISSANSIGREENYLFLLFFLLILILSLINTWIHLYFLCCKLGSFIYHYDFISVFQCPNMSVICLLFKLALDFYFTIFYLFLLPINPIQLTRMITKVSKNQIY